jgi:tetratricopeptide (TPR) repeat protein
MQLRQRTYTKLKAFLQPYFQDEADRRAIMRNAFHDTPVLNQLDFEGTAEQFTWHLLERLLAFGELKSGQPALVCLLDTFKDRVGEDKDEQLDKLIGQIRRDLGQPKAPEQTIPIGVRWVSLTLTMAAVGVVAYTLVLLFRAGEQSVGLVAGLIGLIAALIPAVGAYWKNMRQFLPDMLLTPLARAASGWGILILQGVIVLLLVFGSLSVQRVLARDLISRGLITQEFNAARVHLDNALLLGGDVATALQSEFEQVVTSPTFVGEPEIVVRLARLMTLDYLTDAERKTLTDTVVDELDAAVDERVNNRAELLMSTLAILDPVRASDVARTYYVNAIQAYTAEPPRLPQAQTYLQTLLAVDGLIETDMSSQELSYAHYLHGLLLEFGEQTDLAFEAYRAALTVNDENLEARYALASGLLVRAEQIGDNDGLSEAITVARNGYESYIPPIHCRPIEHDMSNQDTVRLVRLCFQLLTTEAGARILRSAIEDTDAVIRGSLERATRMAEANDHFGDIFFTAEAYYWLAQVIDPDDTDYCDTLRQIITQHDFNKPRHRAWVVYANEQRGEHSCNP